MSSNALTSRNAIAIRDVRSFGVFFFSGYFGA